jgi:hypothetical protein
VSRRQRLVEAPDGLAVALGLSELRRGLTAR